MAKKTASEVAEIVDMEGLDYAIVHLAIPADDILDPVLAKAWREAREALVTIEEILEPYMP